MAEPDDFEADDQGISVAEPSEYAAGVAAVAATVRHLARRVGPITATRTMLRINQRDGFDCPGCAWPDPADTSHAEFCENGAKAVAEESTKRRIDRKFFIEYSLADLATASDFWLGQQGRLTEPMVRRPGDDHYQPIAWQSAFELIGDHLNRLATPDRAVFYTSGRTSNEAAFLYQLLARTLGTNNMPDCSNMCHESSSTGLGESIGIGKGTVSLADFDETELILVIGQNPGTNHPRMLTALESAKQRGARIVAINPLREAGLVEFRNPQSPIGLLGRGTKLADMHLPIRIGADLALFQLVNRQLVQRNAVDADFIAESCDGFEALADHLAQVDDVELLAATGLSKLDVDQLVDWIASTQRIIICWAMGITQHRQGVATIQELANTALLRGAIGLPGAGLCPVRGHSNVQGDRTMGIYEKPATELLDALDREYGIATPRRHGYDTVDAISAMARGDVDVFIGMGGNFVSATPDTQVTTEAMHNCKLTVQVSTKLNRSHVECGETALILPTLGRTEIDADAAGRPRSVTVEDSMSAVHASTGRNTPASPHLRSEVAIVAGIGKQIDAVAAKQVDWTALSDDYSAIRDHIERVIPGFERFNERIRQPGGFVLPNPPRDERRFATDAKRAQLMVNDFLETVVPPGHLVLQTIRSHDQYNTTIYGLNDRYRGVSHGRRVLFISAHDLEAQGFADGDHVDIVGVWHDGVDRRAPRFRLVAYDVPKGSCAAYFPETNVLVPLDSVADRSGTPTSKSVVVRLERATQ